MANVMISKTCFKSRKIRESSYDNEPLVLKMLVDLREQNNAKIQIQSHRPQASCFQYIPYLSYHAKHCYNFGVFKLGNSKQQKHT